MRVGEGVLLGGRYRMVRTIAVGGMGEVWEGLDESLGRQVAVKALRPEFAGESSLLQRFRVEARNSAALSHPNIAPLFDYGEDSGTAYLVMELIPGDPLSDILEAERTLLPSRLLPILSQTARGLHYAHQMGVVHRDVKPGNLIVEPSGRVRITDFGVSQALNQTQMTATGMVMGTAQYLSPEQAVGQPATRLSDLYALGIIAYESLAGQRPFTGGSPVDIAIAQVNEPVPPLPASVDRRLNSLVMRLLDKDPAGRPKSGDELADLFDQLVASTPPAGVPLTRRQVRTTTSVADLRDDTLRRSTAATPTAEPVQDALSPAPHESPAPLHRPEPAAPAAPAPTAPPANLPPSYRPRTPIDPYRTGVRSSAADPVTVGPRRSANSARGARARPAPRRTNTTSPPLTPRERTGSSGSHREPARGSHRSDAPVGQAPTWLRLALLAAVVVLVVMLTIMVGHAVVADSSPVPWEVTSPGLSAEAGGPIPSSPSPVCADTATDDSGGML